MRTAALTSLIRHSGQRETADWSAALSDSERPSFLSRALRRVVIGKLGDIGGGRITLVDGSLREKIGEDSPASLSATVTVRRQSFYRRLILGGSLGAAGSYLDGDWDCNDLTALFRVLARNLELFDSIDGLATTAARGAARWAHRLAPNTRRGSRKNIEAHYDLGDLFFRLFLDRTMMYSSAIFEREDMTLEEAQVARLDRICRKLDLGPSDHVIEIGAGWGGFALHAAGNYGCRVTTTTISKNQFETASSRVREAGLQDRVKVLDQDYRDLSGKYDKLVSLEMIEAIGRRYFDSYFFQCGRLLNDGGRMLIQAIVMPERRYEQYLHSVDFIQKYVFPGGCLPSITAMQESISRQTSLRLLELRDFAPHYARTLREWRGRFHRNLQHARRLGYSDRFLRMWEFYLCYCEAGFEERTVGVVQGVWGR